MSKQVIKSFLLSISVIGLASLILLPKTIATEYKSSASNYSKNENWDNSANSLAKYQVNTIHDVYGISKDNRFWFNKQQVSSDLSKWPDFKIEDKTSLQLIHDRAYLIDNNKTIYQFIDQASKYKYSLPETATTIKLCIANSQKSYNFQNTSSDNILILANSNDGATSTAKAFIINSDSELEPSTIAIDGSISGTINYVQAYADNKFIIGTNDGIFDSTYVSENATKTLSIKQITFDDKKILAQSDFTILPQSVEFVSKIQDEKTFCKCVLNITKNGLVVTNNDNIALPTSDAISDATLTTSIIDSQGDLFFITNNYPDDLFEYLAKSDFSKADNILQVKKYLPTVHNNQQTLSYGQDSYVHVMLDDNTKDNNLGLYNLNTPTPASKTPLIILGIIFGSVGTVALVVGIGYFWHAKTTKNSQASTHAGPSGKKNK